ncbi:hypothetical protein Y1Q_0006843 [Alligator mississippiensis]|uniref:Uncharacterized protein n=1 Tax=Alligator mississippiensis TaxID=8496 RepID=A0A151M5U5_ALLMI|nr:hypothetical protein Y1Q_0006843 [Alligator mississippiensis]
MLVGNKLLGARRGTSLRHRPGAFLWGILWQYVYFCNCQHTSVLVNHLSTKLAPTVNSGIVKVANASVLIDMLKQTQLIESAPISSASEQAPCMSPKDIDNA